MDLWKIITLSTVLIISTVLILICLVRFMLSHFRTGPNDTKETRGKQISDFVIRYSEAIRQIPEREREAKAYEQVVPCGIFLLQNDRELAAALQEIARLGLPDPIPHTHKKINAYEFLKYCQREGIDHTNFASSARAMLPYIEQKPLFWKISWYLGLRFRYYNKRARQTK